MMLTGRRRQSVARLTKAPASVLPLLAAKQRITHANDWMTSDALIACPDPNCMSKLRIVRTGKRKFSHAETTVVGLEGES